MSKHPRSRQTWFLDVISRREQGATAAAFRTLLLLAEPLYLGVSSLRNSLYDRRLKSTHHVQVPVISVGNLTTGGTGKTPVVAWIVQRLLQEGATPGILSRGYRSIDGESNDEKLLLDQLCPGVPHIQNRDRRAGARLLIEQHQCSIIVLDDGFQHRRLHRDLDIVLIDALNPWGYGHLLPRGLLRESIRGLRRAGVACITRTSQANARDVETIRQAIQHHAPGLPVFATAFEPTHLVNSAGERLAFHQLNGKRTCSFTGIGNTNGFRRTLSAVGLAVDSQRFREFPDHHHYTQADLQLLREWGLEHQAEAFVVTRKDLVKLNTQKIGPLPLWAVDIKWTFQDDVWEFAGHLDKLLLSTT